MSHFVTGMHANIHRQTLICIVYMYRNVHALIRYMYMSFNSLHFV